MNSIRMVDALDSFKQVREQLDSGLFVTALAASLIAAFVASALYRFFFERRGTGSQVHRAFPLLGISITTLFIGVQLSIPLSLGLLGALSIIRFRTPIKEPEEIGFIMLVIAASIAAATFNFRFLVLLYVFAFVSLVLSRFASAWQWMRRDGILVLTIGDAEAHRHGPALDQCLAARFKRHRMESASSREGTTSLQYVFSGLRGSVPELQRALSEAAPLQAVNVFLDRPGGIR